MNLSVKKLLFLLTLGTVVGGNLSDAGQVANGRNLNIVTNIPAPVITNSKVIGDVFYFEWLSVTGAHYRIDHKSDLGSPNWIPTTTLTGNGGLLSLGLTTADFPPPQFVRVVALP